MSTLEEKLAARIAALENQVENRDARIAVLENVLEDAGLSSELSASVTWDVSVQEKGSGGIVCVTVSCAASGATFSFDSSRIHGVMFSPWLNPKRWASVVQNVKHRSSDLVVATYPKSGTTLVEQAIIAFRSGAHDTSCFNVRDKNAIGRRSADGGGGGGGGGGGTSNLVKVWPEACLGWQQGEDSGEAIKGAEFSPLSWDAFNALPSPRLLKTHAPSNLVPGDMKPQPNPSSSSSLPSSSSSSSEEESLARFVVVAREPKDVCTSCYYHAWNPSAKGWAFGAWASAWAAGTVPSGSWSEWHQGWREKAGVLGPHRVLLLTYEELTSEDDTVRLDAFARLGKFVLQQRGDDDEFRALVSRVDGLCNFEAMKQLSSLSAATAGAAAHDVGGSGSGGSVYSGGGGASHASHLRHGRSGNWRAHFDADLARTTVDAACAEEAAKWSFM